jgi:hypothetical protein
LHHGVCLLSTPTQYYLLSTTYSVLPNSRASRGVPKTIRITSRPVRLNPPPPQQHREIWGVAVTVVVVGREVSVVPARFDEVRHDLRGAFLQVEEVEGERGGKAE